MRPRWRKVIHDLFDNKARTLLVVFSIAVGVFSIGVIAGAYQIIDHDMSESYAGASPSNIELRMVDFNENTLESVRNYHGIEEAEARRVFSIRVRVQGTNKWTVLELVAFDDFEGNQVNLLTPIEGKTIPGKREVTLERDAVKRLKADVGDVLEFQLPDGSIKTMPLVGVAQDIAMGAGDFLASPYAFIDKNTLQYLQEPQAYNRVYATVSENGDDIETIRALGAELKTDLEKGGAYVIRSRFSETHLHPLANTTNAILGILMALGILIVLLSSSLIANTLAALLQQHMRHIGVIKMVGGRSRQVLVMYLALIMSFGAMALAIAIPLGGQGAYGLAAFIADEMNFNLLGYRIVPLALLIQTLVGLLVPLIAGLAPVVGGSRVTVLSAISGEAARDEVSHHKSRVRSAVQLRNNTVYPAVELLDNNVTRWEWLQTQFTILLAKRGIHIPRPFVISLRNTFRRRGRLILTLFTLTMGGAIFISVFNVRVTLHDYIGAISRYFVADVSVDFEAPYRLSEMAQALTQVSGVVRVEGWQFVSGELLDREGNTLENLNIFAPPAESDLIVPILVKGRWIQPGDVRKFAISEAAYKYYPDLEPGDFLKVSVLGKKETWEVVGIFKFVDREGMLAYAPYEYISQTTNLANRAFMFRIVTDRHARSYQDAKAEELDAFLRDKGYKVLSAEAGSASLDVAVEGLDTLVVFLLIMAVLTAVVGSMGLTGTMGMNVLERTREIGITRAIGADDRAVMRTVIAEGVVIGMVSFGLAILLSIPFTYLLSTIVSIAVFETPIEVHFTWMGYAIWLGLVLTLSAVASILPARNAATMTIREVLAYE
jgi:putative ABC transport system permease protein